MSDEPASRASFSLFRRWAIGLNVALSVLALLAVVVMVNYLANRHFTRFHWTRDPRFQISPMTQHLLRTLTNEVKVLVLFDPEESSLFSSVKGLLTEYQSVCPRLDVEYVNYGRNPERAALAKAQYRLGTAADAILVIFDCSGTHRIVHERELSEFDLSGVLQGGLVRRTGFKGEQFFTSALLSVTDPRLLKAGYVVGHGEPNLEGENSVEGYLRFAELLREKKIEVQPLSLHTNDALDDCQLLVVAGPRSPIPPDELQKVSQYLKSGGRALLLLPSPARLDVRRSGLERLLAEWNVEVGDNLVLDQAQSKSDAPQVLLTSRFGSHSIVRPLHGSRLDLWAPRSVRQRPGTSRAGESAKVEELVFTSSDGLAVVNVHDGRGTVETNGIIPLAVAVEKGAIADVRPDRGATRLVVVGESFFLGNSMIEFEANRDFATLAVNWLLDRRQLLDIGPRPIQEYRISLTKSQMKAAGWLLLGALPGAVLLVGLLVWVRRRK